MGLFKGLKDMKDMVHAAPGRIDQANQLSANGAAMQAQYANAPTMQGRGYGMATPAPQDLPAALAEPIAGVDLPTYAAIAAGLAQFNYDQSKGPQLAAEHGIDAVSWQAALDGWNGRIAASPAVASRFNALYTGRA